MSHIFLTIMWLIIISIMRKTECKIDEVLAISGCNATLEWLIGENYVDAISNSINVIDSDGKKIVGAENMACTPVMDHSISCELRNDSNNKWWVSMVLVNVTQAKSGMYTGQKQTLINNEANITKELKVIDKLYITEAKQPILHEPLSITCTIDGESNELIYQWSLNGTHLNSTDSIMATSTNLTIERLTLVHKLSIFSCTLCSKNKCCIESGTYSPDPYYDSTVASSPDDNRDASTVASSSGQKRSEYANSPRLEHFALGLFIVAIVLVIIGVLIAVTHRHINASEGLAFINCRPLNRPDVGQSIIELPRTGIEEQVRPLPTPSVQENARSGDKNSNYPIVHKKTKSLQKLLNSNQDIWSPVQKSLSLRTLKNVSYTIGRRMNSEESVRETCSSENDSLLCSLEGCADRMTSEDPKIQKQNMSNDDEQNTCAHSLSVCNYQHGNSEQDFV